MATRVGYLGGDEVRIEKRGGRQSVANVLDGMK